MNFKNSRVLETGSCELHVYAISVDIFIIIFSSTHVLNFAFAAIEDDDSPMVHEMMDEFDYKLREAAREAHCVKHKDTCFWFKMEIITNGDMKFLGKANKRYALGGSNTQVMRVHIRTSRRTMPWQKMYGKERQEEKKEQSERDSTTPGSFGDRRVSYWDLVIHPTREG